MVKFILLSFGFIAWAFYEVSGGADFNPTMTRTTGQTATQTTVAKSTASNKPSVDSPTKPAHFDVAVKTPSAPVVSDTRQRVRSLVTDTQPIPQRRLAVIEASATGTPQGTETGPKATVETSETSRTLDTQPAGPQKVFSLANLADQAMSEPALTPPDFREVSATRINMRSGPGTRYNILAKLTRGTRVRVLRTDGQGWVKLKVEDTGRVGWTSARLLRPVN